MPSAAPTSGNPARGPPRTRRAGRTIRPPSGCRRRACARSIRGRTLCRSCHHGVPVHVSVLKVAALAAMLAAPAFAQDVAGHIAAGDAARCRRNAEEALTHFRAALALDSMSYDATWRAAQALVDMGKQLTDNQGARRDSLYGE